MTLEKLICPQCGGNDLEETGDLHYKCNFCGTAFRDEEVEIKKDRSLRWI
ncbi:MAG: hypothetical protein HY064_00075 [Bacteroidetes bacterium]|nr:hypothetical protein [Bacteroidota bacterium]